MSDVDLMTTEQAAARLGVAPSWLANAAREGVVPSRQLGRYRRFAESDLVAYLETVRTGGDTAPRITRVTRGRRAS